MNLSKLRTNAIENLLEIIDSIAGRKNILIDRSVSGVLDELVSYATLQEHAVDKIFWLQSANVNEGNHASVTGANVYITSSSPSCAQLIADHVLSSSGKKDSTVIVVPERTLAFDSLLEENGILGDLRIEKWAVNFIPFGDDFISLSLPDGGFKDAFIDGVPSTLYKSACALDAFEKEFGPFNRIIGKGTNAKILSDLLLDKRSAYRSDLVESTAKSYGQTPEKRTNDKFDLLYFSVFSGSIDNLVIIDRQTDLLTPMLTQLTYKGLIDEFFGVSESGMSVLPVHSSSAQSENGTTGRRLSSSTTQRVAVITKADSIFGDIADQPFSSIGPVLNGVAVQLKKDFDERHNAHEISEIGQFVAKLGGLQNVRQRLNFHTLLAEDLWRRAKDDDFGTYLEVQQNAISSSLSASALRQMTLSLIYREYDLPSILRILCVESICNNGIKDLNSIKTEVIQTYGLKHILTFQKLEALGLLVGKNSSFPSVFGANFSSIRKSLSLFMNQEEGLPPIAEPYAGYVPLSVRLVQCALEKNQVLKKTSNSVGTVGWKGAEDVLQNIKGPNVDIIRTTEKDLKESKLRKILVRNSPGHKPTTLLYYLGGITLAELACIRKYAATANTRIIIATTGLISGNAIMKAAFEI